MSKKLSARDVWASMVGAAGVTAARGAEAAFEAGGHHLMAESGRKVLAAALVESSSPLLKAGEVALKVAARSPGVASMSLKQAVKSVAVGAGGAAGVGAVCDLAISSVEAVRAVRADEITAKQAAVHVAQETGKGALASAAGVLAATALVAVTGPIGPLAFAATTGAAAIISRVGLDKLTKRG